MFLDFFLLLKNNGIAVTLKEYLDLLRLLKEGLIEKDVESFYYMARLSLVKDEKYYDRFDMLFGHHFKGMELISDEDLTSQIPEEWLRKELEKHLSKEEMEAIEKLGGLEALQKRFEELLKEQKERHQGGGKWIGTGGVSPFGAYGYNPEGYRVGQKESRHRRAIKVWDKREFKNLDENAELETRTMKMALRQLRNIVREGPEEELDLQETLRKTAKNAGSLEIVFQPELKNQSKVLLLLDIGGSMDDHVEMVSKLFHAAKHEFKHIEHFYFHNFIYESLWKDNARRDHRIDLNDILNKYNKDYNVIFVGDASMSPYEILSPGGSVEHWNKNAGIDYFRQLQSHFPKMVWLNPARQDWWHYTQSIGIIEQLMENEMYPLTIKGLEDAMRALT